MKRTVLMGERKIIKITKSHKTGMNLACLRFDEHYKVQTKEKSPVFLYEKSPSCKAITPRCSKVPNVLQIKTPTSLVTFFITFDIHSYTHLNKKVPKTSQEEFENNSGG